MLVGLGDVVASEVRWTDSALGFACSWGVWLLKAIPSRAPFSHRSLSSSGLLSYGVVRLCLHERKLAGPLHGRSGCPHSVPLTQLLAASKPAKAVPTQGSH